MASYAPRTLVKPPLVPLSLLVEFEEAAIATAAALADDAGDGCRRVFQMAERGMDPHAFLRERKKTRLPVFLFYGPTALFP